MTDEDISDDIGSVKLTAQSSDYFAIDPELVVASTPTTMPQTIEPPPPPQQQQPSSASTPQLVL